MKQSGPGLVIILSNFSKMFGFKALKSFSRLISTGDDLGRAFLLKIVYFLSLKLNFKMGFEFETLSARKIIIKIIFHVKTLKINFNLL